MKQELGLGDGRGRTLTAQKNHVPLAALAYGLAVRLTAQPGAGGKPLRARRRQGRGWVEAEQWAWLLARLKTPQGRRRLQACLRAWRRPDRHSRQQPAPAAEEQAIT